MELLKTFREITMERNIVNVYNKILEHVPRLMNVGKAGLFLIDPGNPKIMYNIANWDQDDQGIAFIKQVAKYPSNVGLTGSWLVDKKIVFYDRNKNEDEKEKKDKNKKAFISEIDSYIEPGTVNNALYGPLFGENGEPLGWVQLINRKQSRYLQTDNIFSENDIEEFKTILDITATTVRNSNEAMNSHNLVINLITTIKNIHTLFSDDIINLANLHEVEFTTNIKMIRQELNTLVRNKKDSFFKDGVLLEELFKEYKEKKSK